MIQVGSYYRSNETGAVVKVVAVVGQVVEVDLDGMRFGMDLASFLQVARFFS